MEKGRVLIIDDDEIIRKSCEKVLSPEGYIVISAQSGREGLKLLSNKPFDLVLTDLRMPDMNGIDVLKKVKEKGPDIEVIIITGYGTIKSAIEAIRYGAYDYVEKPFSPEELLNVVRRSLERRNLILENTRLKQEVQSLYKIENIVGNSKAIQRVFNLIATVASTESTVLITGESGTGKELVARAIHYNSPRREGPFIVVDCGTIPDNLMEAELFGYTKGAFTGATETQKGLIETAKKGSLFFDEIGNLNLHLQAKLLRLIQEREFRMVGGRELVKADIRIIAATNKDLLSLVKEGSFREDLFYRLNVFPIYMPPLRERKEDIPALSDHFLKKYNKESGKNVTSISAEAMKKLFLYDWPGNIRELENVIHRALILSRGDTLRSEDIIISGIEDVKIPKNLRELKETKKRLKARSIEGIERSFILDALSRNHWNISRAAEEVGMQRTNFHSLMRKYGIRK
ncbi:MAG: sigma-54-dependent transcriptional regulator [Thermodesulfovibrionales bacterium]